MLQGYYKVKNAERICPRQAYCNVTAKASILQVYDHSKCIARYRLWQVYFMEKLMAIMLRGNG